MDDRRWQRSKASKSGVRKELKKQRPRETLDFFGRWRTIEGRAGKEGMVVKGGVEPPT